jgi:SOS-response transcriptional repressor LexA
MPTLTSKQHRVFEAIEKFTSTHGHPPSYRELMTELGYQSTGSIYRFVKALKTKGALEKTPRSWRNVKPTKTRQHEGTVIEVEVIGQISRQHPPELFTKTSLVSIPTHLVSQHAPVYGLVIQDASFLDEHLLPGDLILVEPADTIEPGELVLASTHHSIIGHFFDEGTTLRFHSSPYAPSGTISSISAPADDTQVWGVIVALIRSFGPLSKS